MHQELSLYTLKNLYSEIWCVSTAVSFYFFLSVSGALQALHSASEGIGLVSNPAG